MKTETEIAKEELKSLDYKYLNDTQIRILKGKILKHKQTLQRWLEFLENTLNHSEKDLTLKCEDLKIAIKIYDEAGI